MKFRQFRNQTWPYGFKNWLWQVGLLLRKYGVFKSDVGPMQCFEALDPQSWMPHFMNGLSPMNAVKIDMEEGGENA